MTPSPRRISGFATCQPGLEGVLADELVELGAKVAPVATGGVPFTGNQRTMYLALRWSRIATRVLERPCREECRGVGDMRREIGRIDWGRYVADRGRIALRITTKGARVTDHQIGAAVEESLGRVGGSIDPDATALVVVRLVRTRLSVSFDMSGVPLVRRGWRLATAKAPLPPTIAAAGLRQLGWSAEVPLADPMCGAGTLLIEAARLARALAPGLDRPYAVERWPSFAPGTWASAGHSPSEATTPVAVLGADRDAGAVAAAVANAERADVADHVDVAAASLSAMLERLSVHPSGLVYTNPPWGGRTGGADLRDLYATLGQLAERSGWRLALWSADRVLAGHAGVPPEPVLRVHAGGTPIGLYVR